MAHSTEREAVIDRRALEATALQHAMGAIDLDKLPRESTAWEERRALIDLDASIASPNGTFATPEVLRLQLAGDQDAAEFDAIAVLGLGAIAGSGSRQFRARTRRHLRHGAGR